MPQFIGVVLSEYGEEKGLAYLKQLAKQNIAPLGVSARTVIDQVIAGEYAIGLQIFNHHTVISAQKGAPSSWIPMKPAVMSVLSVMSVVNGGPHPNAGKLLTDFLVSEEGQKLWRDAGYIPIDANVPIMDPALRPDGVNLRAVYLTPEEIDRSLAKWSKIYDEIFR